MNFWEQDAAVSQAPQSAGSFWENDAPVAQARPLSKEIPRQIGLTARYGVQGPAAIPMMVGDAANTLTNAVGDVLKKLPHDLPGMQGPAGLATSLANTLRGSPRLGMASTALRDGLTSAGLPLPEGTQERAVEAGSEALTGAGAMGLIARAIQNVPGLLRAAPLLAEFAKAPVAQATGAGAATIGTDYAKQAGVENPLALAGIALATSMLPGGAKTAISRPLSGAVQMVRPFTPRGKETLVGEALNKVSTTPGATADRLAASRPIVPGSRPMVSDVAQDPGLIGAESALRGMDERNLLGARKSEQNAARQAELDRITGDDRTLERAQTKRDRTFADMAEPAFENARPVTIGREWINNPILRTIQDIRESPAGSRQTVREAMDEAQDLLTHEGVNLSNVRHLYEVRKDLDLLRTGSLSGAGKSGRERSNMRTAERQLSEVIRSFDTVIEGAAPGYRDYMQMFAKRSVPLESVRALQELRGRAVLAAPDPVTGQEVLSQSKFKNLLRNNIAVNPRYQQAPTNGRGPGAATLSIGVPDVGGKKVPVLARLSPQHVRTLDRIAADLDRSSATTSATVKPPGSDTFKNMSVAAVIGRVLGDKTGELAMESSAGKTLAKPLSFLYRVPDRDVQLLMLEAWQDPQLASRLMRQATRAEIEGIAAELGQRAGRQAAAANLYGGENQRGR